MKQEQIAAEGRLSRPRGLPRIWHDRRGVTVVLIGLWLLPTILIIALAIDFSMAVLAKSQLDVAADTAMLAGARAAANALGTNQSNYLQLGQQAGAARFMAQAGSINRVSTPIFTISLTVSGTSINGTASWSASYGTIFGNLFGLLSWPMSGSASANTPTGTVYLNVEIVLDNSGSMEIGATNADIATLQQITPCSATGAMYPTSTGSGYSDPSSAQSYGNYECSWGGNTYDGALPCPIPANYPYQFTTFTPANSSADVTGPSCQGWLPPQATGLRAGTYPRAGAPCAFACHWDTSKPAGTGADFFAVARSTIGSSNPVTLRFDVVKSAVTTLINTMKTNDTSLLNLKVGVFTFNSALTQVYPTSVSNGPAADGWAAAIAAVGAPPTSPNQPDTGIQPYGGGNSADTDFADSMTALYQNYLTASGSGLSAASPKKVLFLVTDGLQDYVHNGTRTMGSFDPSYCQTFKNIGYIIYVVYTPYYPLMNEFYLNGSTGLVNLAEGTGSTSIAARLTSCASSPADYIAASDVNSIVAALLADLKSAIAATAHITK